ncbi:MAG TPA: Maf family protein [candidate division Zixibacteria bacterium]|nr:Maf family protein [candidate division Zixibacteria bacterium]
MTFRNLTLLANARNIILGSASPRRVELLRETGIKFRQLISDVSEHDDHDGNPFFHARKLAEEKAVSVAKKVGPQDLVIGADTIVVLENKIMGKPTDKKDAAKILKELSGKKHTVCTALAFADSNELMISGYDLTDVYFNHVTEERIEEYIETGEPMDKAGAYGIQGMGGFLVDRIEGELDTVIGFPRLLLERLSGEVYAKIREK